MMNGKAGSQQERGTLDGDAVLSPDFLQQAGLRLSGAPRDSFTPVVWFEKEAQRIQGLLWCSADEETPYPLLAVKTLASVDEGPASRMAAAACRDHFMQLNVPPDVMPHAGHAWVAGRTLTPALLIHASEEGSVPVVTVQTWPVSGGMTPTLLRYLVSTSFGQFEDVLQRAGVPVRPDYTPPPSTGSGDRTWLSAATLLELVGDDWHWQVSRQNEVSCQVTLPLSNQHAPEGSSESIPLSVAFYVRYVDEEETSVPCLALRAHTQDGLAQGKLEQVVTHHLNQLHPQIMGRRLPVSVDQDRDLTIRQMVLCPEKPSPALVRHLIQTALQSLAFTTHAVVF